MSFKVLLVAAVAAATLGGGAQAASITSLYNTGVDASGTPAANNATEIHYTQDGGPNARVANQSNGYPNDVWFGDDALSSWIGPKGDSHLDGGYGEIYDFQTTFSLAGLDAATAAIVGQWAVDDVGLDILLNGVSVHPALVGWNYWSPFSITSGFQAGVNTLDFIVQNGGGPIGLRVEMTGTTGSAVPEPATWALMIGGFGLAGATLRRRRMAVA